MLSFLIFPETVRAEEGDLVVPQAQENLHDSSTDSCSTFPYGFNSPRPFPPSPVHSVTDSPKGVSPLVFVTNNPSSDNSTFHSPMVCNFPTPVSSTLPISIPSQIFTSTPFTYTTCSYSTPLYISYPSSSFPQTGPIVFPGSPPNFPYPRTTFSGSVPTFPNTAPIPSMATPTNLPISLFSIGSQPSSRSRPSRRGGRGSRGAYAGRGRTPRGRRGRSTSSTSCQTSPIPRYFWPDYQPSPVASGDLSGNSALNLALMPRVFDHSPASLPLGPLHYDFFTTLRAISPIVIFHCPSPLTQNCFSFVYSIRFPRGQDSRPLLIAGILQLVLS